MGFIPPPRISARRPPLLRRITVLRPLHARRQDWTQVSLSLLPVIAFGAETLHRLRPEGQSTVPASAHVARPIGQQKESKEYAVYVVVKLRRRLAEFIPSPIKETYSWFNNRPPAFFSDVF